MQVATNSNGFQVFRTVTSTKGSWRWQDAFRTATYQPHQCRDGRWVWQSIGRSEKFAKTRANAGYFAGTVGSLHNKPAAHTVDDFGNMVFLANA